MSKRNGTKAVNACSPSDNPPAKNLASSSVLIRSTVWNMIGQATPLIVAIPVLPILIEKLGIEPFGILMLVWMAVGYFSLFDIGLGRALTHIVARNLGKDAGNSVVNVAKTGLLLMGFTSLAGASLIWMSAPWLAESGLHIPIPLQDETLRSVYLIALSVPFIVTSSGLVGILAAYQRFDVINLLRTPMAILTVLLPLAITAITVRLEWITATVVIARVMGWFAYLIACARVIPWKNQVNVSKGLAIREFLKFGGWMTLSNLLSPFLVYMDRFIIAGFISATAVAYYATPYEVITKFWIIPGSIVGTLFPAFATTFFIDKKRTLFLLCQGTKYVFLALFPLTMGVVIFAENTLGIWLGDEFSANSYRVLQILAIGVFINSLAHPATVLIQGAGHPDKVAKLHMLELPLYLPVLWYLTVQFGIEGAAIAWTLRVTFDAVLLYSIASALLPRKNNALSKSILTALAISGVLIGGFVVSDPFYKIAYYATFICVFATMAWHIILLESERTILKIRLRSMFSLARRK